jgi:asparagine synthase (glutamine-hydrolysing)
MCGIAGYVDFGREPSAVVLRAMATSIARRGPDEQGVLVEGPCGFAHTRLSIIDIADSHQPMAVTGRDLSLVFNGEIYNYRQLRSELEAAGEPFETAGDTEVLLRLIASEGAGALAKLDAMFAFAAWDRRLQKMLLARDPLGEKPLFYACPAPGVLVFGSEIKALLQHPGVDGELDLDGLRQALRFRAVYGQGSLHRGIRQLEPGCFLEFGRAGLRQGRFHDLLADVEVARARHAGRSVGELVEEGRDLFFQSVRERLIADVPVGAFLSGGLDSSLIVAAMRKLREAGEEIRTFSVGFDGDEKSELPFAQTVADAIGTHHQPVLVGADDFIERLAELSACRDAPMSEPADVAVAQMSRKAKESVKVVLSGEGADEVFAGYPKYALANVPPPVGAAIRMVGADRTAAIAGMLGLETTRARNAARALSQKREIDRVVQWFSYMDQEELRAILPGLGWRGPEWEKTTEPQAQALSSLRFGGRLYRMQAVDCRTWLPGNMLERGDRMTMAEGLEMRPPFLDKELVAWGLALDHRLKVRGGAGKWVVRQWAADLVPKEILGRKKWGFKVPLAQWFRGPMRTMLFDYLSAKDGVCGAFGDRATVVRLLENHDSGRLDASAPLWTLLAAEVWYQDVYRRRRVELTVPAVA